MYYSILTTTMTPIHCLESGYIRCKSYDCNFLVPTKLFVSATSNSTDIAWGNALRFKTIVLGSVYVGKTTFVHSFVVRVMTFIADYDGYESGVNTE